MIEKYSNTLVEFFEKLSSWENSVVETREISLAQMHVLEILGHHECLRMKELSSKLGVTTGTLTVMVQRLESKGYIIKEKDKDDKRSYFVKLTELGKIEYDNHHLMHRELTREIVNLLGENDSKTFFNFMEEVQKNI